ncbi:MAG: lytic murein transglycosylase [Patescibacteria group bacterium]
MKSILNNILKYRFLVISVIFFSMVFLGVNQVIAQVNTEAREKELQADLAKVEKEIAANRALLKNKQQESASISRDIDILTYQINQARLNIQAKELEIKRLGGDISEREDLISDLDSKIIRDKEALTYMVKQMRDMDDLTLTEIVLNSSSLSELFVDLNSIHSLQTAIHKSLDSIRNTQQRASTEKVNLEKRRAAELDAKKVIEEETAKIRQAEQEKQYLLSLSKSEENAYKQVLTEREAERNRIRNELFRLRDVEGISFGEAYDLAREVEKNTGIRPAFLLAIITQESNLGQHVGSCVISDLNSGQTKGINTGKLFANGIHPTRDLPILQTLLRGLGRDPLNTRVSCPLSVGYGGAMGPSQFIPSTWKPYQARISAVTGNQPPDPWNPVDAFTASGLLLRDLGAGTRSYSDERRAALRYYAGGGWNQPHNAFYGDSVMQIAANIQRQIDVLQGN